MSGLSVFKFEDNQIRMTGATDVPWFCAADVCAAIGHSNPRKAVDDLVDPEDVTRRYTPTPGGDQQMNFVNESGLYALILGSRLESAKRFKRWVTSDVLPAIRRDGRYSHQDPVLPALRSRERRSARGSFRITPTMHRLLLDLSETTGMSQQAIFEAGVELFVRQWPEVLRARFDAFASRQGS